MNKARRDASVRGPSLARRVRQPDEHEDQRGTMRRPSAARIAVGTVCGGKMGIPGIGIPLRLGTLPWKSCPLCQENGCRAILCEAGAGQQEDVDALSVMEQAAIACSILAKDDDRSDVGWQDIVGLETYESYRSPVVVAAGAALASVPHRSHLWNGALVWAEAEARIRNGEVTP